MDVITSRQNSSIRAAAKLNHSAALRRQEGKFLLEGARLCRDAVQSGVQVLTAYFTSDAMQKYRPYADEISAKAQQAFEIEPHVAQLLSDTKHSQGVFCVCQMPPKDPPASLAHGHYLALENIQDPANLGAVLRTGEALGIDGVILAGDCCDLYSPKILRASMGAVFRLPVYFAPAVLALFSRWHEQGFTTWAAVPAQHAIPVTKADFSGPSILLVGNEGAGLSDDVIQQASCCVTIPMRGRAESLNAAASASILMWEMLRGLA